MGDHVFQPGDVLHSMQEACAMDVEAYGSDAQYWKGHRFVGEGEALLKYNQTFGTGRSRECPSITCHPTHETMQPCAACPGRNFAIAELCMLAARMIQKFDFSAFATTEKLSVTDDAFEVHCLKSSDCVEIIDVDGQILSIAHPGNKSTQGVPGMTASNVPLHDFSCRLTARAS